jgi:hypothetical protein
VIFDGADSRFYDLAEYRAHVAPIRETRYGLAEAAERILETGVWGPWDVRDFGPWDLPEGGEGSPRDHDADSRQVSRVESDRD